MNRRTIAIVAVILALGIPVALAQPRIVRPAPVTSEVQRALTELHEQYQTYLRAQGHSGELKCDAAEAWSVPGKLENAANWIGTLAGKRGYTFTSEDQLKHSYAFTAISQVVGRERDIVFGGLIGHRGDTLAFMQRCQPREDG